MAVYRTSKYANMDALLDAVLADATAAPTAILATGGASAAGSETWETTELNGAVGQTEIKGPKKITVTLNSHADWDATTAVLTGKWRGFTRSENLAIPNGGNATLTSVFEYDFVTSLVIPAQTGTNGTFTIGTAADTKPIIVIDANIALTEAEEIPSNAQLQWEGGIIDAAASALTIACDISRMPKLSEWTTVSGAGSVTQTASGKFASLLHFEDAEQENGFVKVRVGTHTVYLRTTES